MKNSSNPLKRKSSEFNKSFRSILSEYPDLVSRFKCINPSLPYVYGLPKTHKQGILLRPIISNVNSPNYKLSKWFASLLSPSLGKTSDSSPPEHK